MEAVIFCRLESGIPEVGIRNTRGWNPEYLRLESGILEWSGLPYMGRFSVWKLWSNRISQNVFWRVFLFSCSKMNSSAEQTYFKNFPSTILLGFQKTARSVSSDDAYAGTFIRHQWNFLIGYLRILFERCFRLMAHISVISWHNPINLYITEKLIKFSTSWFYFNLVISNK